MNEYSKEFNELIKICIEKNQYIGLGNPNANILFIGKEANINENNPIDIKTYLRNAIGWDSNNCNYMKQFYPEKKELRNNNHTWQKFQKLHDLIMDISSPQKYLINFVENVFTTELSDNPSHDTYSAKMNESFKEKLKERKKIFFNTPFIRRFPIVLITALDSNYISNQGENEDREIDNIFEVTYDKLVECSKGKDEFWIHRNINDKKPKIVIHTRQLTNGASNELIELISKEIRDFALTNSIKLKIV